MVLIFREAVGHIHPQDPSYWMMVLVDTAPLVALVARRQTGWVWLLLQ